MRWKRQFRVLWRKNQQNRYTVIYSESVIEVEPCHWTPIDAPQIANLFPSGDRKSLERSCHIERIKGVINSPWSVISHLLKFHTFEEQLHASKNYKRHVVIIKQWWDSYRPLLKFNLRTSTRSTDDYSSSIVTFVLGDTVAFGWMCLSCLFPLRGIKTINKEGVFWHVPNPSSQQI